MAIATVRRWGRSLGVVIPKEEASRRKLREGQKVRLRIEPLPGPDDFSDLFGTVKRKKPTRLLLEELRRGEDILA